MVVACGGQVAPSDDQAPAVDAAVIEGSTLDCSWLTTDNCWSRTFAAARACAPGDAKTGVFSSDRTTCDYADGMHVTFDRPVPTGVDSDPYGYEAVGFEITRGGTLCIGVENPSLTTMVVKSPSGTVTVDSQDQLVVTCPDGSRFVSNGDFTACMNAFLPGINLAWGDRMYEASATGTNAPAFTLFECQ